MEAEAGVKPRSPKGRAAARGLDARIRFQHTFMPAGDTQIRSIQSKIPLTEITVSTAATTAAGQPGLLRPGLLCFVTSAHTGYYSATIWLGSARQSEWRVGVAARVMIAAMIVARKGFVGFVGSCR